MPVDVIYLISLLAIISVFFVLFKRPIYEAMFIGYVGTVIMTGRWDLFISKLIKPSGSSLFYAIVGFLVLAHVFGETKVVDKVINIILSVVGRFRGGAGFVSLAASSFMAALSGTGPGNVAATGVFTIPTMKKTKFPAPLAATTEMSASSLGPMVPPSGTILLAYGVLQTVNANISLSTFWMVGWGVAIWYILQRFLTLLGFCYYYDVEPVAPENLPDFKKAFKEGWGGLLIPIIIFLPLLIDAVWPELIASRVGEAGADAFGGTILVFTPGLAFLYSLWLGKDEIGGVSIPNIFNMLKKAFTKVVPVAAAVYFAYAIAYIYGELGMSDAVADWIIGFGMPKVVLALFIPIFMAILGMVLPGSSQIAIFGGAFIALLTEAGLSPLLAAALLPALTGAMEGMTPPLALAMYPAMGIADSGFVETAKLAYVWIGLHALVSFLILLGILPILGL